MKILHLFGAASLGVLCACQSQAAHEHDHWTPYSVGPSMSRAFLSYDAEKDGKYRDFQWRKKQDINLTIRRHFFNHNPDNPFEAEDPSVYAPRPPHSLLPRPWEYIHLEGLAFEGVLLGATHTAIQNMLTSGAFVPIPIDSLIGTLEDGGGEEFMEGVGETFRPLGQITASFLHDALGFPETKGDAWRHEARPSPQPSAATAPSTSAYP